MGVVQDASFAEAARTSYDAFVVARAANDADAMAAAALRLASLQHFGGPGGRTPALLHEAYLAAADVPITRARLAAALARSWVYGNDAARGAPFALEAVELATDAGDPIVLADALDAQLATSWGPDDLAERLHVTARLQDAAAHVDDVRTRMDAHLWRLTTALETLDVTGVHRQLSALDLLADETGSRLVRYFALTRRAMHATLVGNLDACRELVETAYALGADIGVVDAFAVYHAQLGEIARHANDVRFLTGEAALAEDYAVRNGIQSLAAEAAVFALQAGDTERASKLVLQVAGGGFDVVAHDVDWLLTVTKTTEAAAGLGLADIARAGMTLLAPYAGRCVVNAGAVVCVGVVEDYLWHAAVVVGDPRAGEWRSAAATAYRRLGAPWWLRRVSAPQGDHAVPVAAEPGPAVRTVELRRLPGRAVWSVGPADDARLLPDMKGLHYIGALLQRPDAEIAALDLSAMVAGHGTTLSEGDVGDRLDRLALTTYRNRLRDIDEELDEAQSWRDPARVERIEKEREALLRELAGATGLGGRARTMGGTAERARVAVRKAIATALERIDAEDPATARLLRRTVHTGSVCRYEPDPDAPVDWLL
ncbi:MAG: hypothetical protein ABR520_07575 [Mycobacteriales bacterium]